MDRILHPSNYGWSLILIVFIYTIFLVRSGRLSAHMAISWVIVEIAFMVVMFFDGIRAYIRFVLGEERAAYSLFLLGAIVFVFLMLESLTRISSLTGKLKDITQELALARERLDRAEEMIQHGGMSGDKP